MWPEIIAFGNSVVSLYAKSPAEWTAAILFFLGLVFQIKEISRKKLAVRVVRGRRTDIDENPSLELLVKNVGNRPLGVHHYGFRRWDGSGLDFPYRSVVAGELLLPEQEELDLAFYNGDTGRYLDIQDKDVFFYTDHFPVFSKIYRGSRLCLLTLKTL